MPKPGRSLAGSVGGEVAERPEAHLQSAVKARPSTELPVLLVCTNSGTLVFGTSPAPMGSTITRDRMSGCSCAASRSERVRWKAACGLGSTATIDARVRSRSSTVHAPMLACAHLSTSMCKHARRSTEPSTGCCQRVQREGAA